MVPRPPRSHPDPSVGFSTPPPPPRVATDTGTAGVNGIGRETPWAPGERANGPKDRRRLHACMPVSTRPLEKRHGSQ